MLRHESYYRRTSASPRAIVTAVVVGILLSLALAFAIASKGFAAEPAASDHQPPRFLPAIVAYDGDGRYLKLVVGSTFSYTCRGALDDAQASIEKATAAGRRLVGLCIPVPTYSAVDLVPAADPPKPAPDNEL